MGGSGGSAGLHGVISTQPDGTAAATDEGDCTTCKGLTNVKPVTMLAFRLAATDRVHDSDIAIPYDGMIGNGHIPNFLEGRFWHGPWRVKIFGEGDVENMTVEVTLAR